MFYKKKKFDITAPEGRQLGLEQSMTQKKKDSKSDPSIFSASFASNQEI